MGKNILQIVFPKKIPEKIFGKNKNDFFFNTIY